MSIFTTTYSDAAEGWVSFYSYYPDWMIGMNNYFYTFKGGDLYRHNASDTVMTRNTFYEQWWTKTGNPSLAFTSAKLKSVFNPVPLENMLFKAIDLQGDSPWGLTLSTDLQYSGYIESKFFEKKESTYFAFIRNNSTGELSLRSMVGIGQGISNVISTTLIVNDTATINFSPSLQIDSMISVGAVNSPTTGDALYWLNPINPTTPIFIGTVVSVTRPSPSAQTTNQIVAQNSTTIPVPNRPSANAYYLYVKNSVAESHGVLGHYCVFYMENVEQSKIELFSVEADVMKSYP